MNKPNFVFAVNLEQEAGDYFQHAHNYLKQQKNSNQIFWSRLGGKPDFKDARVLEVGCGLGSLSLDIALSGAKKVVGIDLNSRDIEFAKENLQQNYSYLTNVAEFIDINLQDYPEDNFDYVISKDAFEHVMNLDNMLSEIKQRLKSGGKLYAGFGPLWYSPFGFHGNINGWNFTNKTPWGHLLFTESKIISKFNSSQTQKIQSLYDFGMNKMSIQDYRRGFQKSGLSIIDFQINRSNNLTSRVLSFFRNIPLLEDYCSHNIYCLLEKPRA